MSHSHEDRPFIYKEFNSRKIPKHHVDDKEEERSTPAIKRQETMV